MLYNVDIVVCVDLTCVKAVEFIKSNCKKFMSGLELAYESVCKHVDTVRIKIISFCDTNNNRTFSSIAESRFFNLTDRNSLDTEYYNAYIKNMAVIDGSGKCHALEAIAAAIKSEWTLEGDKYRQIIIVLTDSAAYHLEDVNNANPYYPLEIPTSFDELTDLWMTPSNGQGGGKTKLKQPAKRLVVFGPQMYPWPELFESWDQVVYNPLKADDGFDYDDVIYSIVGSV